MVVIEKRLMFRYSGTPMIIGMDIFWSNIKIENQIKYLEIRRLSITTSRTEIHEA